MSVVSYLIFPRSTFYRISYLAICFVGRCRDDKVMAFFGDAAKRLPELWLGLSGLTTKKSILRYFKPTQSQCRFIEFKDDLINSMK